MKSIFKYIVMFVIFVVVIAPSFFYANKLFSGMGFTNRDIVILSKRISSNLERNGPELTYNKLRHFLERMNVGDVFLAHTVFHLLGNVMYKKYGLEAIKYCDASFSYGCYHGVFNAYIMEYGMSSLGKMFDICRKTFGDADRGCQHGIGHGIAELEGPSNLLKSLNICKSENSSVCMGGVFMEYNFPLLYSSTTTIARVRPIDQAHPYSPCDAIPYEFRKTCYVRLTEWWEFALNKDYKKMATLCASIPDKEFIPNCYMGIGAAFSVTNGFDTQKTKTMCGSLGDNKINVLCLAGSFWIHQFSVNTEWKGICDGLTGTDLNSCRTLQLQ